ncbi:hypothetical protein OGAPHI_004591 [Ogataea philodendri]|uniref:Tubulin-folding cofactor D ARM repeats domain-containing protein n=1 Tax=Ogataea philodendri TaxID=1378263 RepID=A0A9P8P391_9ASCO|nr:uncharacterized protein OGAPHI_004591 [Ogataea philodendri]KAH3664239.1 hypothetical protein OGAPHI_004591 [Ogataea philodendri]
MEDVQISKLAGQLLVEIDVQLETVLVIDPETSLDRLLDLIDQFQANPQLLDTKLRHFIVRLVDSYKQTTNAHVRESIAMVFYAFAKTRGIKVVSNCLTSDLYSLTSVQKQLASAASWQESFFLLVWLSILVLVPFPLEKTKKGLSESIYKLAFEYLSSSGKENDASALLMARLLSRSDCQFLLDDFVSDNFNTLAWESKNVFEQIGLLTVTNHLFKLASPNSLHAFAKRLLVLIANELDDINTSTLRLFVKNLGKLGVLFIKLDEYDPVEEILNYLIGYCGHSSTQIRYSVAKQLAKISSLLPQQLKDDIANALYLELGLSNDHVDFELADLELFHGVLLSLGEFARTHQLNSKTIPRLSALLHQTLFFQQHRVTHFAGASVRDATCFIIWSLAKRYRTGEIPTSVWLRFFHDLVLCCCFDKELVVRRASSACVQEVLGRHGEIIDRKDSNSLKVRILETLDYATLGRLDRSFELSLDIIGMGLMENEFKQQLETDVLHRDYDIRTRAAKTLRKINNNDELVEKYYNIPFKPGKFYVLAELLQDIDVRDVEKYHHLFDSFSFDFHKDTFHQGEEYLYLLTVLIKKGLSPNSKEIDTVFNVIRNGSQQVSEKFHQLAPVLELSDTDIEKWLYYIKNGNMAAARAVGRTKWISGQMDSVLDLIGSRADAEVRSCLISSISEYLHENTLNTVQLAVIISGLDDYTITNRGDVGSHVRSATIKLISENKHRFEDTREIRKKLARISGEVMERLRLSAFELFVELGGRSFESPTSYVGYFEHLTKLFMLDMVQDRELSREFWKGYALSAGSPQSLDPAINAALCCFFELWEKLDDKKTVLGDILSVLKPQEADRVNQDRVVKTQDACLRFLCNLLELNLEIPADFALRNIFVRVYNLTLGKTQTGRIVTAIRIFAELATRDDAKLAADCRSRLLWLSKKHPVSSARLAALEALQELQS